LNNGSVVNIAYDRLDQEMRVWDLKIGNQGKGLISTDYAGSGPVHLRELDLSSDTLNGRPDAEAVEKLSTISRSNDRSFFFIEEAYLSNGGAFTYDAIADTFQAVVEQGDLSGSLSTVSRDGSFIALEVNHSISVLNQQLEPIQVLAGETGVVFHPTQDVLFVGNFDEVIVYETSSWTEMDRFELGEDLTFSTRFGQGNMSISDTGEYLFVSTPSGIRMFNTFQILAGVIE
jgi:hypothetical protein